MMPVWPSLQGVLVRLAIVLAFLFWISTINIHDGQIPPEKSAGFQALNKMRKFHILLQSMDLDNFTAGKSSAFVSSNGRRVTVDYLTNALVSGSYATAEDMREMRCLRIKDQGRNVVYENFFNVFPWIEDDSQSVFLATANWQGPGQPISAGEPFNGKFFAMVRRGGDGQVYSGSFATNANIVQKRDYTPLPLK